MTLQELDEKLKLLQFNYWFLVIGFIIEIFLLTILVFGIQEIWKLFFRN